LILLAFSKNVLDVIKLIKSHDGLNFKTPAIALLKPDEINQKKKLLDAGFEDCLIVSTSENQIIELINEWETNKSKAALNYIALIHDKTKHNRHLTLTIFQKLFEELPWQINIIKDALHRQEFALAEETAHKLHGSVSFCNLEEIRKKAYALENGLKNGHYEAIDEQFLLLEAYTLKFTSHQHIILTHLQTTLP
jgi:HPt (histidine-containing phosphotransfer) domain-containing protein